MNVFDLSAFPTLTTERLILRETIVADADDIFALRGDREVQKYNTRPMRDVAEATSLVHTMRAWYATHQAIQWGITLRGENRVVGLCGLHDWMRRHRRAAIGYDLVRELWGQSIAYEAMCAVVELGFERMNLNRIEAVTIAENERSIRLLNRLGFQQEGIRRDYTLEDDGAFHGSAIFGLLRTDYHPGHDLSPRRQG
jgi:[ribosomal protein S5]-alanine N-acetyltransferase